ncbi:MAG: MFS transporter [Opitutaceae bacterium]
MTSSDSVKRYLPWLVAVALFMEQLDATILNTAVPVMATGLGVEPLALKAVLTSYTLSLAVFIPVSGWMADRFGTRRVFMWAVAVFALGSLLCGLAVNVPMLVASRVLQGMGGAMMTPVGRIALVRTFPRSDLLRTMNYVIIPAPGRRLSQTARASHAGMIGMREPSHRLPDTKGISSASSTKS